VNWEVFRVGVAVAFNYLKLTVDVGSDIPIMHALSQVKPPRSGFSCCVTS